MTQVFWVNQPQEQGAQLDVVHGDALGGKFYWGFHGLI
jgi:hypothetical protein